MAPPKRPWFRFYVETFSDFDIRSMTPTQRWVWAAILGMARTSPVAGVLLDKAGDPITDETLADFAAVRKADVKATVQRMTKLGSVYKDDNGALVIAKWDSRQFESDDVASRVAKHRSSNGVGNDDVTPDAPPDETESPSVVLTEVQRTELVTSSSSEPLVGENRDEEDPRIGQAIDVLVRHDAAALEARGEAIRHRNWFTKAAENRRGLNLAALCVLVVEHPDWTGEQLAEEILEPKQQTTSADAGIRERNARRARGETCPKCLDGGTFFNEEKGLAEECPCKWSAAS